MKRLLPLLLLLLLLGLLWSQDAFAAVANDGSGTNLATTGFNAGLTTGVSLTTFTVGAGANRCLIGIIQTSSAANDGSISSVTMTWNGTSMTSRGTANNTSGGRTQLFTLVAPASGNNTMAAAWSSALVDGVITAIEFSGADQSTCVATGDTVQITGNAASPSITIASTTDGATVAAFTDASAVSRGGSAPQTDIYFDNTTWVNSGGNFTLGGTSNDHSISAAAAQYSAVGVHVLAASAGGATPRNLTLLGVGD